MNVGSLAAAYRKATVRQQVLTAVLLIAALVAMYFRLSYEVRLYDGPAYIPCTHDVAKMDSQLATFERQLAKCAELLHAIEVRQTMAGEPLPTGVERK